MWLGFGEPAVVNRGVGHGVANGAPITLDRRVIGDDITQSIHVIGDVGGVSGWLEVVEE